MKRTDIGIFLLLINILVLGLSFFYTIDTPFLMLLLILSFTFSLFSGRWETALLLVIAGGVWYAYGDELKKRIKKSTSSPVITTVIETYQNQSAEEDNPEVLPEEAFQAEQIGESSMNLIDDLHLNTQRVDYVLDKSIYQLLEKGYTIKEIASEIGISKKEVKRRKREIKRAVKKGKVYK